ncbi:hypothetical protein Q1695_004469 [Nippostrongylus brasiliensis]|nr:hypothetical protein Q1695_004469 [Nippostrongylus brasiliensis]
MKLFPNILVGMIYLNTERLHGRNYTDLASNGVNRSGRAFYLTGEAGKIGVWHVLPTTEPISGDLNQKFADVNHPVVVYFHGNYYDRTYDHRVELYNTLTSFGYNVVAFDYRGFGDSDGHPTDTGVTMDGRLVYNYVKQYSGNNTVIIWGHSLGTAIATRAVKEMSEEKKPPDGLVLEAPFSNLLDMFMTTWLSYSLRWMPTSWIHSIIVHPTARIGQTMMDTNERIQMVDCPILILHAVDDESIPVEFGRKVAVSVGTDRFATR